ncbi:MAG: histidine kinase [Actinomycetota bacterium]
MKDNWSKRIWAAWAMFLTSLGLWLGAVWLGARSGPPSPEAPQVYGDPIAPLALSLFGGLYILYSGMGVLLRFRRPGNNLGWLFCAAGLFAQLGNFAGVYAYRALVTDLGGFPAGPQAALFGDISWLPGVGFIGLLFLLFPSGHVESRWEGRTLRLLLAGMVGGSLGQALERALYGYPSIKNPLGFRAPALVGEIAAGIGFLFVCIGLIASIVLLMTRFRRSEGERRQQLKWFAYSGVMLTIVTIVTNLQDDPARPLIALEVMANVALPVSIGIAILKYRLYDIDIVINKTLVFGALAAFITAVYVAIVVGVGSLLGRGDEPNVALSIAATAVVAVAFQPVRLRVQRFANRLVYGKRAEPYEVLSQFSEKVAGTEATEEVLLRTARVLSEGTGARRAEVWLRVGSQLVREATWPEGESARETIQIDRDDLPELPGVTRAIEVRHQDELLGALALIKVPGDPLKPAEEKLLEDLASQAGLVLRNVGLTADLEARLDEITRQAEELRASRQRIIEAQDTERRKLERNIHDGAQQHLVALAVKLRLAKSLAEKDPEKARALLRELQSETTDALDTLRDLARGIYPPLLEEKGVAAALKAQAAKGAVSVTIESESISRAPLETEGTVYFCCLEALQNIGKYANASQVRIRLSRENGALIFSVEDDGAGFDPATQPMGSGLPNMRDRVEALGGSVGVTSAPGKGTRVSGRVPAEEMEPVG